MGYYEGAEDYFLHTRSGAYDFHRDEGPRCGFNCSQSPNLQDFYSVNVFSDEAVERIPRDGKYNKGPCMFPKIRMVGFWGEAPLYHPAVRAVV